MPAFSPDDPLNIRLELESVPVGSPASVVARQLVSLLTAGELAPGSRLPSERILSERLGVGRSAVREALAALEILGIVQIRPGSGTYLRGGTSDLLPTTLSWGLMLASNRTRELLEIRSSLERTAAILAAQRATTSRSPSSASTWSGKRRRSTTRRPSSTPTSGSTSCWRGRPATTCSPTCCRACARC